MSFQFRACTLDQPLLLAPSLQQWLPEGHLARFIADVTEQLDRSAIYSAYDRRDGRGQAQSDALRADGGSRAETAGRSGSTAKPCRGSGRGRRWTIREGTTRR